MTGNARTLNLGSAPPAGALNRAAMRLRRTTRRLWAGAQVPLNLATAAPRSSSSFMGATVIPTVRYRDVPAAVRWLCRAFGMKVHRIVTDADGAPRYAELTVGAGMLMVAPIEDTPFGRMMVQPDEIGGVETQVCYLFVGDARAHARRAKAAGAVIVIDPDDEANKGRGYSCRDPEGHVWNFGVYDPWGKPTRAAPPAPRWGRAQQGFVALMLLALAGALVSELLPRPGTGATVAAAQALAPPAKRGQQAPAKTGAPAVVLASLKAGAATGDKVSEADKASENRAQLAAARGALAKVEREATAARAQLAELQRAKLAAERAAADARAKLAAVQKDAEQARAQVALERAKRIAAVRAALKGRRSVRTGRPRPATWCYSLSGNGAPPKGGGRLNGFCKG